MDTLLSIWKNRTPDRKTITPNTNRDKIIRVTITSPYHNEDNRFKAQSFLIVDRPRPKSGQGGISASLQQSSIRRGHISIENPKKDLIFYYI